MRPQSLAWSPDGTQLIFQAPSQQGYKAWVVPAAGGSPHRLLPEDTAQETYPGWSPDGRKIIFATGWVRGRESHICILDLASHQIRTLPGSDGKFAPLWSPDGQSILAPSLDVSTIYVLNIRTQQWSALNTGIHADARWSSDSRSIYFLRYAVNPAILRVPAAGGEAKVVAPVGFPYTGTFGLWLGLDPTDAPLMLRDVSTTDIYALTLEEK